MVREKPSSVFQDFQYVKLTDEPLFRIKGIKKKRVELAPENKIELTTVALHLSQRK
jgi:hypothetical protein